MDCLKRYRVDCRGLRVTLLVLLTAARAPAQQVVVHCEVLPVELQDELSARVRLLVAGHAEPGLERIEVECSATPPMARAHYAAGVRTEPLAAPIDSVEDVLNSVERLLVARAGGQRVESEAAVGSASDAKTLGVDPVSVPANARAKLESQRARDDVAQRPRAGEQRTIGGVGLSASAEPWPGAASTGLGPRLDVGVGWGSWSVSSYESFRFGTIRGRRLRAFDALVGIAWGAPFAEDSLGLSLAFGREWLSAAASTEPVVARTSASYVAELGLRVSRPFGSVAIWLAVGGRFRAREIRLAPPVDARLNRWSLLFSLGVALRAP